MITNGIDFSIGWSWFLLSMRFSGALTMLPGVGTEEVPMPYRLIAAFVISAAAVLGGFHAANPQTLAEGGLMITSEFLLGFAFGLVPAMILGGAAVAGQAAAGVAGLTQANMMDPSLGEEVAILARLQTLVATLVFLGMDGHLAVLRACAGMIQDVGTPMFLPGASTAALLSARLSASFELALRISAPILVTILVTKFVLGLITKFVPQINIFIISLPLTIALSLYLMAFTYDGFTSLVGAQFAQLDEILGRVVVSAQ